jgi:hypothetical protein
VDPLDTQLAAEFVKNPVLQEFDILNGTAESRKHEGRLCVYTPIDCKAYIFNKDYPKPTKDNRMNWMTSNTCRIASQILTGVEVFEILTIFEKMRDLKLAMLPVSLHHDGFSILAKPETVKDDIKRLAEAASQDLSQLGLRPVDLEFAKYRDEDTYISVGRAPGWIQAVIGNEEPPLE